jgi:hypothetical protein
MTLYYCFLLLYKFVDCEKYSCNTSISTSYSHNNYNNIVCANLTGTLYNAEIQ